MGVFNKNCMITYAAYRNIFPIWALGEYRTQVLQMKWENARFPGGVLLSTVGLYGIINQSEAWEMVVYPERIRHSST